MQELKCEKCGNTEKFKRNMALYATYWITCDNEGDFTCESAMPSDINDYKFWTDEPLSEIKCVVCGEVWDCGD